MFLLGCLGHGVLGYGILDQEALGYGVFCNESSGSASSKTGSWSMGSCRIGFLIIIWVIGL